jgi:hypothetical protein
VAAFAGVRLTTTGDTTMPFDHRFLQTPCARRRALLQAGVGAAALPAVALGLGGCAAPATMPAPPGAEPLPPPTVRVGDTWRYLLVNRYNSGVIGETTARVTAVAPEIRVLLDPDPRGEPLEERYHDAWSVLAEGTFDGLVTFETPMPLVPAGGISGTSQLTRGRYRSARSNDVLDWSQQLRLVGWERVTVPAGQFDALRIQRMINFRHPDVFRYDPRRTDTLWYAPAVNRWVAREWTGDFMSGGPAPQWARAREDWVSWQLVAYGRGTG